MKNFKKGFTLIELLVVIAIIGILASVVLASLNSARDKANKAAFKAEVSSLAPAAIAYCDGNTASSYSYTYLAGTKIAGGTILCTTSGTVTSTTISPSPAISCTTGTLTGTVSDTGTSFTPCT